MYEFKDMHNILITKVNEAEGKPEGSAVYITEYSPQELHEKIGSFSDEEKVKIFEKELANIDNEEARKFCRKILLQLPEYFWFSNYDAEYPVDNPTSMPCSIISHTKECMNVIEKLIESYDSNPTIRDIFRIATMLKDGFHYGKVKEGKIPEDASYNPFHALILRRLIESKKWNLMIPEPIYKGVLDCIEAHQGQWAPSEKLKPKFGQPEFLVHQADYLTVKGFCG